MSTFMAVVVLGASKSYVFITFFKQLFLCTTLGVSHGLILLPVMLGTFGPPPYETNAAMFEHDGDAAPEGKEDLEMH
jgi:Niemann-Pick C1 protein